MHNCCDVPRISGQWKMLAAGHAEVCMTAAGLSTCNGGDAALGSTTVPWYGPRLGTRNQFVTVEWIESKSLNVSARA